MSCPPAPRARSTATRCRGHRRAAPKRRRPPTWGARRVGWPGCGGTCSGQRSDGPEADFFALGGGSLAAAQLVAVLRQQYPQVTVADLYDHPRLGSLAGFLDELEPPPQVVERVVRPTPRLTQAAQTALSVPLATLAALPWVTWLALGNNVARALHLVPWTVAVSWWLIAVAFILFVTPRGSDGHHGAVRADVVVECAAGHLPSRRVGAPAGLVRRAAGRGQRCAEPGRGAVAGVLRPRARRRRRQRASTCTPCRRSPGC